MPLLKNILVEKLREFMDKAEYPGFTGYPQDESAAREALSNAVYEYSKDVAPPSLEIASSGAKSAMFILLEGMSEYNNGITVIKNALNIYAVLLGHGMSGFTAIPPIDPVLPTLEDIQLEDAKTSQTAANELADIIHTWFTAWMAVTSNGAKVNWS